MCGKWCWFIDTLKWFPCTREIITCDTALKLGIVTGCCTRPGTATGYSRVRVRVGFIQPWPYPYPQPGVGRSVAGRHIQTPREKPVNVQPKRRQTHRM